jgi:allantoin racemase
MSQILVINPNSNQAVTDGMQAALPAVAKCVTLTEGPFGIETQNHIDSVIEPLRQLVADDQQSDAFVIACYSDPGLQICRATTTKPVFGIQESGVLTALSRGEKFGVIALGEASIRRHLVYLKNMNVMDRLAGERAADLSVAESASGTDTFDRLARVGAELRDHDGADVLVLGCAGMASHRAALEQALGIPVIEPVQAAVEMAITSNPDQSP